MSDNAGPQLHGIRAGIAPGSRIGGYVVEQQAGAGGMATVYRARDEVLGRTVALKVLAPALARDPDFRARFLRESRAIAAVDEEHILPVYAAGEADGALYIAARFVAGGDLAGLVRRAGGPVAPARASSLITQVAAALDAAHATGLVHRDVKPGNILIDTPAGRAEHAYLADFGLTKMSSGATGLTTTGTFMGTPDYCSPEQITGRPVDGRTDQYSLACVAFNLLTGILPFAREQTIATLFAHCEEPVPALSAIRHELPPAVDGVLARAMAKQPARRYASCGEFAGALRAALSAPARQFGQAGAPYQPAVTSAPVAAGRQAGTPFTPGHPSFPGGQPAFPVTQQAFPAAQPTFPGSAGPPGKRGRKPAVIAGSVTAAVAIIAGIAVFAMPSPAPSRHEATTHRGPYLAATLTAPDGATISQPAFSTDGTLVAASGYNGKDFSSSIYVWSTATGKLVTTLTMPGKGQAVVIAFSAGDRTLLTGDASTGEFYRLNLATGQATALRSVPANSQWATSADGSTLATVTSSGTTIDVTTMDSGTTIAQLPNPVEGTIANDSLALDSTGQTLIVSGTNGDASIMDVQSGQVIATVRYDYKGNDSATPQISPDGKTVYVPSAGTGPGSIWDVATMSNITPHDARWPQVSAGALYSSDGSVVTTFPDNGTTNSFWDVTAGSFITTVSIPDSQHYTELDLGPGGRELLLGDPGNSQVSDFTRFFLWGSV